MTRDLTANPHEFWHQAQARLKRAEAARDETERLTEEARVALHQANLFLANFRGEEDQNA